MEGAKGWLLIRVFSRRGSGRVLESGEKLGTLEGKLGGCQGLRTTVSYPGYALLVRHVR